MYIRTYIRKCILVSPTVRVFLYVFMYDMYMCLKSYLCTYVHIVCCFNGLKLMLLSTSAEGVNG